MIYIELTTDKFADRFQNAVSQAERSQRAGTARARRPLRGLEIKDDTYAYMKIVRADGSEIKMVDSGSVDGTNTQYSNFLLQSVQEERMEKHQVVDTFGEPYLYIFGEAPRFINVSAVLVDSLDFNWYAEFWENYNRYFRATRSVELGARTYLFYDDNVVEGYVLMASASKDSMNPLQASLQFRMYVTNYENISTSKGVSSAYPIRSSVNLPASVDLTKADPYVVGRAAASAEVAAYRDASLATQVTVAARQQSSGFAGVRKLSDLLRLGAPTATGNVYTDGVLQNALGSLGNTGTRTKPLRGLIADNLDEFTAYPPPPPAPPTVNSLTSGINFSLHVSVSLFGKTYGADMSTEDVLKRIGIQPQFLTDHGIAIGNSVAGGGGYGAGASFGAGASAAFGAGPDGAYATGGVNGGLGFTDSQGNSKSYSALAVAGIGAGGPYAATSTTSYDSQKGTSTVQTLYGPAYTNTADLFNPNNPLVNNPYAPNIFAGGIAVRGGVSAGTGIGGGIAGGLLGGVGPNGPGTIGQFSGGGVFAQFSKSSFQNGLSGAGAVIQVGGAPSAFSTVAVPGTFNKSGSISGSIFLGPNGIETSSSRTGIFN